jgi:hypothetical protein
VENAIPSGIVAAARVEDRLRGGLEIYVGRDSRDHPRGEDRRPDADSDQREARTVGAGEVDRLLEGLLRVVPTASSRRTRSG